MGSRFSARQPFLFCYAYAGLFLKMELYTRVFSQACFDVNKTILNKYDQLDDEDFKDKTHFFNERYENIYLEANKIHELKVVINSAVKHAAKILNLREEKLACGFWFNVMNSGDVTTAHTHDDDDELLSCVYYLKVPEDSGNLIVSYENKNIEIKPKEGEFVFFSPATLHEVTKNNSQQPRFSLAFNFGLVRT